mgnify:CR=1 FL=1
MASLDASEDEESDEEEEEVYPEAENKMGDVEGEDDDNKILACLPQNTLACIDYSGHYETLEESNSVSVCPIPTLSQQNVRQIILRSVLQQFIMNTSSILLGSQITKHI